MTSPVRVPPPIRPVFEYFWVVALAVTAINYIKARRALDAASLSPDGAADGHRYLRTFVVMSAIPWVVMGLGQQRGDTRARRGVRAFHGEVQRVGARRRTGG